MAKSIIVEGKTSTEAIEKGLKELKVSKDKVDIKILENLSINQNVICWVLSYIGVAYAEANNLCYLSCAGWFLFLLSSISIMITLIFYTIHYCRKKWNKED